MMEETKLSAQAVKRDIEEMKVERAESEEAEESFQEMADEVTLRRLDALEVVTKTIVGDKLKPEQLDQEILMMKEMFVDMVDQILENEIEELDSNTVVGIKHQNIPLITKKLRLFSKNPPKINSYAGIVRTKFPNGVKSEKDQLMNEKKKIVVRSISFDDDSTVTEYSDLEEIQLKGSGKQRSKSSQPRTQTGGKP